MFRQLVIICRKSFSTSSIYCAKPAKGSKIGLSSAIPEPEPVRDTKLLQEYCCGLNYMAEGKDPEIKNDEEYPEWLWKIHTGPPKTYKDYDPNTREYWYALEKAKEEHREQIEAGQTFYRRPRIQEINFNSRLQPKKEISKQKS